MRTVAQRIGIEREFDQAAICGRIATARVRSGLTQRELSGLMDTHERTIQTWETGERVRRHGQATDEWRWTVPWTRLAELAWHLRTTRDWLLYGD